MKHPGEFLIFMVFATVGLVVAAAAPSPWSLAGATFAYLCGYSMGGAAFRDGP
jgi:hypothetical protein